MSSGTLTAPRRRRSPRTSRSELIRAAEHGVFGVVPIVATLALVAYQFKLHAVALDFHVAYYPAASRLLHGLTPYAATPQQINAGTSFVYPALAALLFAPFALVSGGIAQALYMVLCIACVPAVLVTLRVRDWRLYGLAMLWFPVFDAWQSGNVTLPMMLVIALLWRHRERPVVAGVLVAAAISIKPFVWPLALWLLATRRWKAAAWALTAGVGINLAAWGVLGYDQIAHYLHLSARDTDALWRGGYSMLAVAHHLGLGRTAGEAILLVASVSAAAALLHAGLRRRDDRAALTVAVLLMLVASPLLWAHYFALLLIPLALYRPRLSPVWALPLLLWPIPPRQPVYGWEELLAWAVAAVLLASASRASRGRLTR